MIPTEAVCHSGLDSYLYFNVCEVLLQQGVLVVLVQQLTVYRAHEVTVALLPRMMACKQCHRKHGFH